METIKKKVRVIVESVIEVELTPEMFNGFSHEEYLKDFSQAFWDVDSTDDLVLFAARTAAVHGRGEQEGLGTLAEQHVRKIVTADVYFDILEKDIDAEFVDN